MNLRRLLPSTVELVEEWNACLSEAINEITLDVLFTPDLDPSRIYIRTQEDETGAKITRASLAMNSQQGYKNIL